MAQYFKKLTIHKTRVRVADASEEYRPEIREPSGVADLFRRLFKSEDREIFAVFLLDVKNKPMGVHVAGVGGVDLCVVDPREVYRAAVMMSASAIIVAHNHPSGSPSPSKEDIELTERLMKVSKILGVGLLDHVIVADDSYYSFAEHGQMPKALDIDCQVF